MVPTSSRPAVLNLLHGSHQGVKKHKAKYRNSVWWLGIAEATESMVAQCKQCASTRMNPAELLIPTPLLGHRWDVLGMNRFHSKKLMLVVGYYSHFPEVITLPPSRTSAVVETLKSIFVRNGIPEVVRSDNKPPSQELKRFSKFCRFTLVTSSPHFPQSNGEVE